MIDDDDEEEEEEEENIKENMKAKGWRMNRNKNIMDVEVEGKRKKGDKGQIGGKGKKWRQRSKGRRETVGGECKLRDIKKGRRRRRRRRRRRKRRKEGEIDEAQEHKKTKFI
jgi:hypothetical protein